MASALIFTHDRHRSEHMKKGPKLNKVDADVSEESPYLKRKSMSLNQDGIKPPQRGGSTQALAVSSLSRDERRDLRKKLKLDLVEVKRIVNRIEAKLEHLQQEPVVDRRSRDVGYGHSLNNGVKGPAPAALGYASPSEEIVLTPQMSYKEARLARQSSEVVSVAPVLDYGAPLEALHAVEKAQRKSKGNHMYLNLDAPNPVPSIAPEKVKPKVGSGGKKTGRHGSEVGRPKRGTDLMKQCGTFLKKLMAHKHAWVFNKPVDAEDWGILDYHTIIKKPMDLGTVKKRLESGYYTSPTGMADDVRLTFSNAMTYNPPGHEVYVMASAMGAIFEKMWKDIAKRLMVEQQMGDSVGMMMWKDGRPNLEDQGLRNDDNALKAHPSLTRARQAPGGRVVTQSKPRPTDVVKRSMTFEEKEKLSKQMESLPEEKLVLVIEIMRRRHPEIGEDNEEVEVDIESIDNETLWELERFISNYMKSRGKKSKVASGKTLQTPQADNLDQAMLPPAAAGEMVRVNGTGEDAGEEDVDIDDDLAPAQFAPVEIDKDGVGADGEGSSAGDSSDSGSASSDSDSDSSSGSESEAEDVQGVGSAAKADIDDKV